MSTQRPRVVIIGGGFAGLEAARAMRKGDVDVVLLDKRNYHVFQPLLYQVATAGLSPADVAAPLRAVLNRQANTRVILGHARSIDRERREVILDGGEICYDYLIIATGMINNYFGNDAWEEHAPGLKSLEEAVDLRRRMLLAFEAAEYEEDAEAQREALTFVIIGGGPTGVEMAGAIREIAAEVMTRDFRNIDPANARIILIEGQDRLLAAMSPESSAEALRALQKLGVEVRLNTFVKTINAQGVQAGDTFIRAKNAMWAAGLRAEPLVASLGATLDRAGRAHITQQLHLPDDERVFVLGDVAHLDDPKHGLLPGLAPVAIQQGQHAASNILRHARGASLEPFKYNDKGSMATIGRASAVAETGSLRLKGFLAWLAWLFVHLMFLIGFRSKLSVLINWMYAYVVFRRSSRLIVGVEESPLGRQLLAHAPRQLDAASRGPSGRSPAAENPRAQAALLGGDAR